MARDFQYTNLTGGILLNLPDELKDPYPPKIILEDCKNVYYDREYGLRTMYGNRELLHFDNVSMTGLHKFISQGVSIPICTTSDGKLYNFKLGGDSTLISSGLLGSNRTTSTNANDSLVVASLGYLPINYDGNLVTTLLEAPMGGIITEYKNRIFMALGATLYYSALGDNTSWIQIIDINGVIDQNSGGFIENFYSSAPITALERTNDYLVIHKEDGIYLLTGNQTSNFDIVRFSYKGSLSPYGIVNAYKKHWYFNDGINRLMPQGEFGQLVVDSVEGQKIDSDFQLLDKNRLNEAITIVFEDKHQIWWQFPYIGVYDVTNWWVYDYINQEWYRREQPQIITCALEFDDEIILTGTNDGRILQEFNGHDFAGEEMVSEVNFANLFLQNISAFKTCERLDINFEKKLFTKCRRILRYDGDITTLDEDEEQIIEEDRNMLVLNDPDYDDDVLGSDNFVFPFKQSYIYKEMLSSYFTSIQLCLRASSSLGEFIAVRGIKFHAVEYEDV